MNKVIKRNMYLIGVLLSVLTAFSTASANDEGKLKDLKSFIVEQQVYFSGEQQVTDNDDRFGWSISISGNQAIVGAVFDKQIATLAGAAYIFEYDGIKWNKKQKLTALDGAAGDRFGQAVSIDGNRVIIGAPFRDSTGVNPLSNKGSAYIFEKDSSGIWNLMKQLFPNTVFESEDRFGNSVNVSGDRVLVGAFGDDNGTGVDKGAVYAYTYDTMSSQWVFNEKFSPIGASAGDGFGYAISLDGNLALISAIFDDTDSSNAGAVYVYQAELTMGQEFWIEKAKLLGSDSGLSDGGYFNDFFGRQLSLYGNTALIGVPEDDLLLLDNSVIPNAGSAYVFEKSNGLWSFKNKFRSQIMPSGKSNDFFGRSVSVFGNVAVIGNLNNNIDTSLENVGSAETYKYDENSSKWNFSRVLQRNMSLGHHIKADDNFGYSVALSGTNILIGAWGYDHGQAFENNNVGAFFHFVEKDEIFINGFESD